MFEGESIVVHSNVLCVVGVNYLCFNVVICCACISLYGLRVFETKLPKRNVDVSVKR